MNKSKAAFRRGVSDRLNLFGFDDQNLNSREWRMVDVMFRAGRGTDYACVVVMRVNRMRKHKLIINHDAAPR
jgi:hypothetical protein